jgi:hypothetical protein
MKKQELKELIESVLTEGYTLSWEHLEDFDNKEWAKIIKATVATIKLAKSKGIEIAGPHGDGKPKIDKDKIALNGSSDQKSDGDTAEHESFVLSRERHKFGGGSHSFVKTARKPYDAVVATILAAAQKIAPKKFKPGGDGGLKGVRPGGMGKWKWLPDKVEEQSLSENTKALEQAYKVYSASVVAFEEMANKLKDSILVKWSRELNNLHGKVLDHLDDSYPGSVDESVKDVYRQNLPSASYHELEIGEMGLRSLVKNTRKDKDLIKFSKAHRKIMVYVKAHLHKNYPDWEK